MRMSKRISGFQASPIRRLVPYANDAKRRGVHVFHLNIGQPDIITPPQVIEAVRDYDGRSLPMGRAKGSSSCAKPFLPITRALVSMSLPMTS